MAFMDVKNSHLRKLLETNEDSIPLWNNLQATSTNTNPSSINSQPKISNPIKSKQTINRKTKPESAMFQFKTQQKPPTKGENSYRPWRVPISSTLHRLEGKFSECLSRTNVKRNHRRKKEETGVGVELKEEDEELLCNL